MDEPTDASDTYSHIDASTELHIYVPGSPPIQSETNWWRTAQRPDGPIDWRTDGRTDWRSRSFRDARTHLKNTVFRFDGGFPRNPTIWHASSVWKWQVRVEAVDGRKASSDAVDLLIQARWRRHWRESSTKANRQYLPHVQSGAFPRAFPRAIPRAFPCFADLLRVWRRGRKSASFGIICDARECSLCHINCARKAFGIICDVRELW